MAERDIETAKGLLQMVIDTVADIVKENDLQTIFFVQDWQTKLASGGVMMSEDYFPSGMAQIILNECEVEKITPKAMLKRIKIAVEAMQVLKGRQKK